MTLETLATALLHQRRTVLTTILWHAENRSCTWHHSSAAWDITFAPNSPLAHGAIDNCSEDREQMFPLNFHAISISLCLINCRQLKWNLCRITGRQKFSEIDVILIWFTTSALFLSNRVAQSLRSTKKETTERKVCLAGWRASIKIVIKAT